MRESSGNLAVAITGVGAISAYGTDSGAFYRGLMSARPVLEPVQLPGIADGRRVWWSVVPGFNPLEWMSEQVRDGSDVVAQWSLAAANQAISESGADLDPIRTAVVQGTSFCGVQSVMRAQYELDTKGPAAFPRKTMLKALTNMGAAQIAMRHGLHGPSLTVATACASSLDALGTAARLIAEGRADAAVVVGVEAGHSLASGQADGGFVPSMAYAPAMFGMQSGDADVSRSSRPFDVDRSGVASSEGAASFVIECADKAQARGARILGYVLGYGSVADAHHPAAPDPSGQWEALAMRQALDESKLGLEQIDCLYAHATGTPVGDVAEIRAINAVYGDRAARLPVTSVKGHFGHAAAASGGMSLIAGLGNMVEQQFVNTANTTQPDPEAQFDVVLNEPRQLNIRAFQVNAFGFGGQNASIVVARSPSC